MVDMEFGVLYLATKQKSVIRKNVKTDVEGLGALLVRLLNGLVVGVIFGSFFEFVFDVLILFQNYVCVYMYYV